MDLQKNLTVINFGTEMLKTCFDGKENVLISPLSAAVALAMTAKGAKGDTLEELRSLLAGNLSMDDYHEFLSEYVKTLPSSEKAVFHMADSLWFPKDFRVSWRFKRANEKLYGAEVHQLPFDEKAVEKINDWVNGNTKGMIDKIIESISPEAPLYLINALAFDAEWAAVYREDQVGEGKFTNLDGSVSTAMMMSSEETLYLENPECRGFIKDYAGGDYAFLALLPEKAEDFEGFVEGLTGEKLLLYIATAKTEPCDVEMPKFTCENARTLTEALKKMGAVKSFSDQADFHGITKSNICIGDVIQKTFIEVDERGTKAGAVTAVMMKAMMMPEAKPEVILDRPFVYAIIDRKQGIPMFLGTVTKM